jgi:hypothetical protein
LFEASTARKSPVDLNFQSGEWDESPNASGTREMMNGAEMATQAGLANNKCGLCLAHKYYLQLFR